MVLTKQADLLMYRGFEFSRLRTPMCLVLGYFPAVGVHTIKFRSLDLWLDRLKILL